MTDLESWNVSDSDRGVDSTIEDTEILSSNLAFLNAELQKIELRRDAQIKELAEILLRSERTSLKDNLSDFFSRLLSSDRSTKSTEAICLCTELIQKNVLNTLIEYPDDSFSAGEPVSPKAADRVAYLQNRFTDSAFLAFSATLSKPRAAYFSSFSDVCEEVYHGLCEFRILPIENTEDGKLVRFYKLIEKYELKIVAVCDIPQPNQGTTRYALLRHRHIFAESTLASGKDFSIEISLTPIGKTALSDILSAAAHCGMYPTRIDSLPGSEEQSGLRCHIVFEHAPDRQAPLSLLPEKAVAAFLLYLSLSLPEYTQIGIYQKINPSTKSFS